MTGGNLPRVLILPASYGSSERVVGGGERYAYEYARALAQHTRVTMALFGPTPEVRHEGGLRVETFTGKPRGSLFWPPPATRAALLDYDVYHAMIFPTPATDYLLLIALWHGKKVILTDVGGGGPSLSTRIRSWLGVDLHRQAHGLALVSQYSARFFEDWPQPRAVLWGGIRAGAHLAWSPPQGFALFVGRLLPHKGVLPMIEALPPGIPLKIIGESYDPEYRERLARAAQGRDVEFLGRVSDEALDDWYARASVVVQPSLPSPGADKSELLGLAAIEAMAHAKPVIVTRSGSLPDLVVPGVTGFVVPPGDPAALGDKIALLCRDPHLSVEMGRAAQRLAQERFTWEAAAERGLQLYGRVLGGDL